MSNNWFVPEEELTERVILAEGLADFVVKEVSPGLSKTSSLPMLTLTLIVTDKNGVKTKMMEYLLQTQKSAWKVKSFLDAIGMSHLYTPTFFDNFRLLANCFGKCELITIQDVYNNIPYEKTKISRYIKDSQLRENETNEDKREYLEAQNQNKSEDDDLPF